MTANFNYIFKFQALNSKKTLIMDSTNPVIENVAVYLECLPLEAASSTWSVVIPLCETFLRKIVPLIQPPHGTDGLLRMMAYIMRLPGISAYKVRFHCAAIALEIQARIYILYIVGSQNET